MKKILIFAVVFAITMIFSGCSAPRITNTGRSAIEQYLLAVTIERLTEHSGLDKYAGKKIYFDYTYLAPQVDKPYLQGRLEMMVSKANCEIVAKQADADVMIQPLCGVLATDNNTILFGTPQFPIPLPQTDLNIVIPEIPIFKVYDRVAYGRLSFNIFDAKTRKPQETNNAIKASTSYKNWIICLIPFRTHNFDMKDTKDTDLEINVF